LNVSIDTIRDAVRHTAAHLKQNLPPETNINVWFTGHSLGTALASLVYARAINEPHEFGRDVVLRDAYLFATPILADVQSVHAFHNRLNHDSRRSMWRITNGLDAVATALPDSGDNMSFRLSPYNLFSFAHLGMELTLREAPAKSVVRGNAFAHGTRVHIESAVEPQPKPAHPPHGIDAADERAIEVLLKLEKIPILGRLLAHGPAPYWYMLQNVQLGECEWHD
jgi:Lipase (class 3)